MTAVFDPLRLGAVAFDILLVDRAGAQAIAARQQSRLAALVAAAKASALYRAHLRGHLDGVPHLEALPPITRHELMRGFDDWVTDPALHLSQLRAFTANANAIAEPFLGKYQVWESSGTSGEPGVFVQDARAMAVHDALEALRRNAPWPLLRWLDPLMLRERIAFVGATGGHFASFVTMQRLRRLNPWMEQSLRCFSIGQSTAALVRELNRFAPSIVATYPSAAAMLAEEAASGSLRIALKEVWTGGETLSAAVRRRVEQVFGCPLRNSYGASEFLTIGWECGAGRLHANADWVILEPVDRQHRLVPPGEPSHSTLLTNLANHVQPLIRYDLGDRVSFAAPPCACGSPLPVIEVQGRHDDALVMAGRNGKPVTLLPLALTTVLEDEAGEFDFQLRQLDARTLVLRLGLHGAPGVAAARRCHVALEAFARLQGLLPIRVRDELGQPVPRGRSGKPKRIVAANPGPASARAI